MINDIIRYENGELDRNETLELFSELIHTGQAWELQGHYGRTAAALIENNIINNKGTINWEKVD